MSFLTMLLVTGSVTMLGVLFAVLIFKLDSDTTEELSPGRQEPRWNSLI